MTNNNEGDTNPADIETVCDLIDKLTLRQLHLLEDKIRCEVNIESSVNSGSIHLAKTRYILGQTAVSAARLPVESSPEFSASTKCETTEEDGVKQLKVVENNAEDTVNPLRWFGVLLPQNLHKAQSIFHNAISYIIECVNIQLQLNDNTKKLEALKEYKCYIESQQSIT